MQYIDFFLKILHRILIIFLVLSIYFKAIPQPTRRAIRYHYLNIRYYLEETTFPEYKSDFERDTSIRFLRFVNRRKMVYKLNRVTF